MDQEHGPEESVVRRQKRREDLLALLKRNLASLKLEQSSGIKIDPKIIKELEKGINWLEKELS